MSKINKIKLSGTTYDVEDANASKTVELTQAQYDALVQAGTVDPNTFYIITDAQTVDISEYWTSGQTQSAIDSAVSGKQDTLIAGDNITISGNVISASGSSITIESAITSGSTNAVEGGAIYDAVNAPEYPIEGALSAKHFWDDENMGYYTEIGDSTSIKVPNSTLLSYPYIAYAFASDSEFMGGGVGYVATVTNGAITDLQMINGSSISTLTATYDGTYTYFTPDGSTFNDDGIGVIAVMGMDYEPMDFMELAIENGADVGIISVVGSISAETLVNRVNRIYDDVSRLETFNPIADTIALNDNDGNGRNLDGVGYGILNYNTYNPLTDKTTSGHTADIFKYSSIDFKGENNVLTFNGSAISMDALKNRGPVTTISEFTDGSSATTDQWNSLFGYDSCFIINTNSASSGGSNQSMSIEISGPNSKSGNIQLQLDNSNGLTVQVSYNDNSVSKTIKPFVLGNSYIIDTRKAGGWGDEVGIHTLTVSNLQGSDFISSIKFYSTYNATIPIADIAADVAAGTYARNNEMFDELSHLAREEEVNFYDYGSPSAVTISTGYASIYDFYGIVISGMSEGFYIQVKTDNAIGNFVDGLSIGIDGNITSSNFPDEPIPYYLDDEITKFENGVWNIYFAEGTKAGYLNINTTTEASAVIYKSFTETPIKDAVSSIQNSLSGYVETSAITSAVTSASTDSEIPTAKAVYDAIGGGGGGGINSVAAEYDDTGTDGEFLINVNSGQSFSQIFKVGSGLTVTEDGDDVILSATGGGGSITIDPSLDTGSTNAVANSAITNAINSKVTNIVRGQANWAGSGVTTLNVNYTGTSETTRTFCASINNKQILTGSDYKKVNQFSLVETSAITTSVTSSSTDAQVPSAKAVYDAIPTTTSAVTSGSTAVVESGAVYSQLGGLKLVKLTQTEYDNLGTKDSNTLYVITTS